MEFTAPEIRAVFGAAAGEPQKMKERFELLSLRSPPEGSSAHASEASRLPITANLAIYLPRTGAPKSLIFILVSQNSFSLSLPFLFDGRTSVGNEYDDERAQIKR